MLSRRDFIKWSAAAGAWMYTSGLTGATRLLEPAHAALPGGTLDPVGLPKFVSQLLVPPVMPRAKVLKRRQGKPIDYYEISMRQFRQQVLPAGYPMTTVWGYGAVKGSGKQPLLVHSAPSFTIEARAHRPVRVKWINDLVNDDGTYLRHLLPVDPTLHWANPEGGPQGRDTRPTFTETPGPYQGPVPMVPHLHGAVGVGDESDGYPEAWFLPDADDTPAGFATEGTWYDYFAGRAKTRFGATWGPGYAVFQYPNENRASTLWYHDHTLGMTRLNVYTGPAGFYLVRGGPSGDDAVVDSRTGDRAILPGPAPREGDKSPSNKTYYEIPLAIQDRAFNEDGSLFYPGSREFFDGIVGPYIPEGDEHGSFSPIWNPEFFGNTIIVNGATWPYHTVEQRRYRLRFLNGCQSRFLVLDFNGITGAEAWQIGNEGGFLAKPVNLTALGGTLLLGLAERADVIVDFTNVPVGDYVLRNAGSDEPFGGLPIETEDLADPQTTGQIMQFRVVPATAADPTTPPAHLTLPAIKALPTETVTRPLALIEMMGMGHDADGSTVEGPTSAMLGTADGGVPTHKMWMEEVTENPAVGATEVWELYNTTGDAHPIHVHEVVFEVVNREGIVVDPGSGELAEPLTPDGTITPPEQSESGFKDTVIAYPGQITRVRAQFKKPGQFVWHCHIIEHEDNEMMRPYRIGPEQPGQPMPM